MLKTTANVLLLSESSDCRHITDFSTLPLQIKVDAAMLIASDYCEKDSLKVFCRKELYYFITCKIIYPRHCKIRRKLLNPEPVTFSYFSNETNDVPYIYSERVDFPRDFPHLNPVIPTSPVSFCIAREGAQPIYDAGGIAVVVKRLSEWLRDATAGRLDADGWEPYPRSSSIDARLEYKTFQEVAFKANARKAGSTTGIAKRFIYKGDDCGISIWGENVTFPQMKNKIGEKHYQGYVTLSYVPWIYIWGKRNEPNSKYDNSTVTSGEELVALTEKALCRDQIENIFELINEKYKEYFRYGVIIIIGQWRPRRIIEDIPGLSNSDARKCELMLHLLTWENCEDTLLNTAKVKSVMSLSDANSELFRKISGHEDNGLPITMIGCGALGSHITDNLVRAGTERFTLVDYDTLRPHNLARHVLVDVFKNKAVALRDHILKISPDAQDKVKPLPINILDYNSKEIIKMLYNKDSVIIDSSADTRVRNRLCQTPFKDKTQIIRTEIGWDGRLGLMSVEGNKRNPRLDDLHGWLSVIALDNDSLASWLSNTNKVNKQTSFNLGLGCASATTIMPNSTVAIHAAAMHPAIETQRRSRPYNGKIGLNILDDNSLPLSWSWFDVPNFNNIYSKELGWSLRIANTIYEYIEEERMKAVRKETAGFLYGNWNTTLKVITVLVSTPPPKELNATENSVELPPAGKTPYEKKIIARCGNTLAVIGSWHSHPHSSAERSLKDMKTFKDIKEKHQSPPRPTVMLITGKDDNGAFFDLPDLWK